MLSFIASLMLQVASPPVSVTPASTDPSFQIELRDGRTVRGTLAALEGGKLNVTTAAGPESVSLDDLVLLESLAPPAPPAAPAAPAAAKLPGREGVGLPAPDLLFLAAPKGSAGVGDRLVGQLVGGDQYGLRFTLSDGPSVTVPFDHVERLLPSADRPVDRLAQLPGGGQDDRLWRRGADGRLDNLDSLTGVVDRVESGKLVFEGALGTLTFSLAEVLAVVFASEGGEESPLAGTPVLVRLAGGSRLSAGLLGIEGGSIVLASRSAERLAVPLASLAALVVRGPSCTPLAELVPSASKEWPSVGRPEDFLFPWRADLSVTGRLLSVDGRPRATGLGVHSNSQLTFAIPPGADVLRVTVGISDEVGELPVRGSVTCDVLVDGVLRATSGVLHAGDPPVVLRVTDLGGAHELQLVTGDAGDDDAGDRAAWVDGVLLGPRP